VWPSGRADQASCGSEAISVEKRRSLARNAAAVACWRQAEAAKRDSRSSSRASSRSNCRSPRCCTAQTVPSGRSPTVNGAISTSSIGTPIASIGG